MSLVGFGQPDDGIIQMCYVVPDIRVAMATWADKLKVGPWFLLDHFSGTNPRYRGKPSEADVSLAMSFAGHMNIELIQPNDAKPSVYREWIDKHGYGFHHWGRASKDFDKDIERYQASGHDLVFLAGVPSGGNVAYMDTTAQLPGYVELIEIGASFEATFSKFYRASIGWDGTDPVRAFILTVARAYPMFPYGRVIRAPLMLTGNPSLHAVGRSGGARALRPSASLLIAALPQCTHKPVRVHSRPFILKAAELRYFGVTACCGFLTEHTHT